VELQKLVTNLGVPEEKMWGEAMVQNFAQNLAY